MKYIVFILSSFIALNSFSSEIKIWSTIPFLEGANIDRYLSQYGKSRVQHRRELVSEMISIMQAGASAPEAMNALKEFNRDYGVQMVISKRGLGVSFESAFKAGVRSYYDSKNIYGDDRHISFNSAYNTPSIMASIHRKKRPGYYDSKMADKLDYLAYGVITHANTKKSQVTVTLNLVHTKTHEVLTFQVSSHINSVMNLLAKKVVLDLQGIKLPYKVSANLWLISKIYSGSKITKDYAISTCEALDGRLPTTNEMKSFLMKNSLQGGFSESYSRNTNYFIKPSFGPVMILRNMKASTGAGYKSYGQFLCVRDHY